MRQAVNAAISGLGIKSINGDTTVAQFIVGAGSVTVGTVAGTTTVTGTNSGTVTSITATAPAVVTPSPLVATGVISVNDATSSTHGVVQPDNVTITIAAGVISAVPSSSTNFSDNETPSGGGPYTLAHTPNPAASLQLFVRVSAAFGWILYVQGLDYTLATATITITNADFAGGALRAWYRY